MFFDGWSGVVRVVVVGALAYLVLVALLRVTGKRTVSKWNAFDLIVTMALGSTLATVLLSETVSLAEGVAGIALLVGLQYAITWVSVRSGRFRGIVKNRPSLLLRDGQLCREAMKHHRVTEGELHAAVRSRGHASLGGIDAIVLETDGTFSVITEGAGGDRRAMADVEPGTPPG